MSQVFAKPFDFISSEMADEYISHTPSGCCSPPQAQGEDFFWKNPEDTSDLSSFPLKSGPELEVTSGLGSLVMKVKGEACGVYPCSGWVQGADLSLLSLPDLR